MKLSQNVEESTNEFLRTFPVYRKVINRNENGDPIEGTEQLTYEEAIEPLAGTTPDAFMVLGNPAAPFNYTDTFDTIDRLSQAIDNINFATDDSEV